MPTFLVECYWPRISEAEARVSLDRIVRLGRSPSPGRAVGSFGCILVPADGMALFLLSAPSDTVVRRIGTLIEVPFDRILESVHIRFHEHPT
jgi:hypothetical protein